MKSMLREAGQFLTRTVMFPYLFFNARCSLTGTAGSILIQLNFLIPNLRWS